jgi:hypothetical protein
VRLANARGTLWSGAAEIVVANGRWTLPVAWQLEAWPLLRGEARIALRPLDGAAGNTADVVVRDGAIEARDVSLAMPAAALDLPAGVSAGGELRVTSHALTLATNLHQGNVRVDWIRPRIALPGVGVVDLGAASATLAGEGARWRGPVEARGGALVVDGEAIVDGMGADLSLALVPQPGAQAALRALLGPADAQGTVRLRATPRFR